MRVDNRPSTATVTALFDLLSSFARRRTVWLPTWQGWMLLAVLVAGLLWGIAPRLYGWLAVERAALGPDGRGAKLLVVEGWLSPYDLAEAVRVYQGGRYERVVTTGGPTYDWPESPVPTTFADRAADFLVRHGLPADRVTAVPAPEAELNRTYVSALQVRAWAERGGSPVAALDLYTAGAHARRSRMVYRLAFGPGVEIGALTSHAVPYDPVHWWTSSAAAKLVVAETLSTAWTICCFWPPEAPAR